MNRFFLLFFLMINFSLQGQDFFSQPAMNFISKPTEITIDTAFTNIPIEDVQRSIDNLRKANPTVIIRIKLKGFFTIKDTPLLLSSKMLLFLDGAEIKASTSSKAGALIKITDQQFVSIDGSGSSLLDGNNEDVIGILVDHAGKIHIDHLSIKNCNNGGLNYTGNGLDAYADNGSVTRMKIDNCKKFGIQFTDVFNFICTDNVIKNCKAAILMNGNNAAISNNSISSCNTGIMSFAKNESITNNKIVECDTAIALQAGNGETLVAYNDVVSNKLGFWANGSKSHFYHNICNNLSEAEGNGTYNELFSNKGITPVEGSSAAYIYFNPPLIRNQHKQQIKIGKGRVDMVFNNPSSLLALRAAIDSAHLQNPNTVLVIKINGLIKHQSNFQDSLVVKDDECFLMNGGIESLDSSNTPILFQDKSMVSFSGGYIDGHSVNGKKALVYITGQAVVILDSLQVLNSRAEGITKRNSTVSTYISACYVDNSIRRGIWQLASSRLYAFENKVLNSGMDGFDLDAYSSSAVLLNNISNQNKRHGIFVEEGANNHLIINNYLSKNAGGSSSSGISFFNKEVDNKHTSKNLAAFNLCTLNSRGIMMNAAEADKSTENNVLFNNICLNNLDIGIGGFYNNRNTRNNYSAYNTVLNNINGSFYFQADFDSNTVWNMFDKASMIASTNTAALNYAVKNGLVQLNWKTAALSKATAFEIFYGDKPYRMFKIAEISAGLNNQAAQFYAFVDSVTSNGISYYSTKMVDELGGFILSPTLKISHEGNNLIRFKCNKISANEIKIEMSSPLKVKNIDLNLLDLQGNSMVSMNNKIINNTTFVETIPVGAINNGLYILKVNTELGLINQRVYLFK